MKQIIKRIIEKSAFLKILFDILKYLLGKASVVTVVPLYFDGWKMATGTRTPWMNGGANAISRNFAKTDLKLKRLVAEKKIILTQFNQKNVITELDGLTWRHYLVYWSANFAIENTKSKNKKIAEFGVCDGLTVFYAISAAQEAQFPYEAYLYDAWEGMKEELLLDTEKSSVGSYSYLSLENTKNNLKFLGEQHPIFNKGYIPEAFASSHNPEQLTWMHIDLNSAMPTICALKKFWAVIEIGGVVLLDDYAWPGYEDTQKEVEIWASDKHCNILHLPTGQAIIFKLGDGLKE